MAGFENEYRLAARLMVAGLDADAMAHIIREDRKAVVLDTLAQLELAASSMTVAMTVSQPQPLQIAIEQMRDRLQEGG